MTHFTGTESVTVAVNLITFHPFLDLVNIEESILTCLMENLTSH